MEQYANENLAGSSKNTIDAAGPFEKPHHSGQTNNGGISLNAHTIVNQSLQNVSPLNIGGLNPSNIGQSNLVKISSSRQKFDNNNPRELNEINKNHN